MAKKTHAMPAFTISNMSFHLLFHSHVRNASDLVNFDTVMSRATAMVPCRFVHRGNQGIPIVMLHSDIELSNDGSYLVSNRRIANLRVCADI